MGSNTDRDVIEGNDVPTYGTSLPVPNVQEMVRQNPLQVPERYIRNGKDILENVDVLSGEIPVIDLSSLARGCRDELDKLDRAIRDWGFFQLVNHGMSQGMMQAMKKAAAEFFELPLEEKSKFSMPSNDVQGYGHSYVSSEEQKLDWTDIISLLIYPIQFRRLKYWPTAPEHFKETLESYSGEVRRIGNELIGSLAPIMGIDKDAMLKLHGDLAQALRINYYPTCSKPNEVLGISPHSDTSIITILMQSDDIVGLQIRHDGTWVPVKPVPDALVVNLGDVVEIWTNGKYRSIEHRAVTNENKPKISFASFIFPPDTAEIEPLDHMVDHERPYKMYKKMKYGEYLRHSMKKEMDGKSHTQVAKLGQGDHINVQEH